MVQNVVPPFRRIVLGDGLENDSLAGFAHTMGWEVMFASSVAQMPAPDVRTAVVVKAQKFGRDLAALQSLLAQPIGYLGLMGPAHRKQRLLTALLDEGLTSPNASFSNLFGPSGLDVGAETPAEVALAIVAEIQAVMSGHAGGSLREKRGPVHLAMRELKEIDA